MAAADYSRTEWGIVVGGTGTDATAVATETLRVKAMAFAGNADNATCTCTTSINTGTTAAAKLISCIKFKTNANDLDAGANKMFFGDKGVPMTNLTVTLSHADDRLYIYVV
jgi:hypothetical protein